MKTIFIIALIILVYGSFSKFLQHKNISGPMVFLLVGLLLSPLFLNLIDIPLDSAVIKIIAEVALIVVLFSDSSSLNLKNLKTDWRIPTRLLAIGLPLTIIFSTYVGTLFFPQESLVYIFLMALILAPTDAALGKAVVTDKNVPLKIRESINVESGLNDGIVFPLLITTVLMIVAHEELGADSSIVLYLFEQISIGFGLGALSGFVGAKLLTLVYKKKWVKEIYKNLLPISLAIFSYYVTEHIGGNGFIAAFVSGAFFGNFSEIIDETRESFLESEGEVLILISFLVFGVAFVPASFAFWDTEVVAYSLLSLTVLRILPVALSLSGLGLSRWSKLFIGWFGPRGIASILYVMTVAQSIESISAYDRLFSVITLTILLSIVLHGLSAKPLVNLYVKIVGK